MPYFIYDAATGYINGYMEPPQGESPPTIANMIACTDAEVAAMQNYRVDLTTAPPSLVQIDAAIVLKNKQAAQWDAIKAERVRRTQGGGYYVASVGKWFDSDQFSRTQQIGLLLYGAGLPPGIQWKTMDNTFIVMTPALAQAIFATAGASDIAIFTHSEQLHAQVLAAADPMSVDVLAGWPKIYGE